MRDPRCGNIGEPVVPVEAPEPVPLTEPVPTREPVPTPKEPVPA